MTSYLRIVAAVLLLALFAPGQDAGGGGGDSEELPTGLGKVAGQIYNATTGVPVRQASLELSGHVTRTTLTNTDGSFVFQVPPGTYTLRVSATNYFSSTVTDIVVTAGELTDASSVLAESGRVTTVNVEESASAVSASAAAALVERRLAPMVSDSMSSEEIRKSVASDAAGALEKMTGVSIVGNGFVYVRGLGERYSATMMNNAMLPSTEPERRVVPLDLFPASLIDSIKVLKSYTPDLPGEFSGGLVQLQTTEFPTERTFRVSSSFGFNTRTTYKQFSSYPGGSRDFFGFDDGTRQRPSAIPDSPLLFPGNFTQDEFQQFGRAFANNWEPTTIDSMRPNQSYSVVAGDTFGKLGVVAALTFSNTPQRQSELQRYLTNQGGGQAVILTDYDTFVADSENARLGGILNAAYRFNSANKISFRNTLTRDTDKESRLIGGFNGGTDTNILGQRLRWIERGMIASGVEGEHALPRLGNSLIKWQFTYSTSMRDEPDLREVFREPRPGDVSVLPYLALPSSGLRFFNKLNDRIYEPHAEFDKPFYKGSISGLLRVGFRATLRERDFAARRFRFVPIRIATIDRTLPSNQLFAPENITPDRFQLRENTRGTDTYDALMDVYAGFGMLDVTLGSRWRVIGGARIEDAKIEVNTIDPLVPGAIPAQARLVNRAWLPGVNAIYTLGARQNLRFAYGRTVSRPDFRELSPFDFTNVLGGFNVVGNPNLRRTRIDNLDARWEFFPGGDQLLAASFFLKYFDDPIEPTIQPTTSDLRQSFINADSARNYGLEIEARKSLQFLSNRLRSIMVHGNFTWVESSVTIPEDQRGLLTSLQRPLTGQSRFIYNAIAEWNEPRLRSNARFYLNSVSRRITEVGAVGLPDIFQQRNTFIDFVYEYQLRADGKLKLRFDAENLTDNTFWWTQQDIIQRRFQLGRTFRIGTSFSVF
ncbi:MAG: TonB-dependent receptor [Bryobacterales bacterium]|nr:TonB-dependent receptor [Bryobacterales bacterium]